MNSCSLTIFEGPDGAGKTTAARNYAESTQARYVHLPALPRVHQGLGRMYVEAMLPALLGYQPVVFDRSWLSELPYGVVFREGQDRLGNGSRRMLERLALRCGAVVVHCDPGWESLEESFIRRRGQEMLKSINQLRQVRVLYAEVATDLPEVEYNYLDDNWSTVHDGVELSRDLCHPLALASAGCWSANTVLVGEDFGERKDADPFYQWPFASFSREGCSQWLAQQLDHAEVGEQDLLWVNADQDLSLLLANQDVDTTDRRFIALGLPAKAKLEELGIAATHVPHPQGWKRFKGNQAYPLKIIL
jgi:hypothetical protein